MKLAAVLLPLIFLAGMASGQVMISGQVKDNRGRSLPGASITIKDSYDGATSDSIGHFRFTTTEKGDRVITVTAVGYRPVE